MLDHQHFLSHVARETSRFSELIESADLTLPVAACPGWNIEELTRHLGTVHRWATGIITSDDRVRSKDTGPEDTALLRTWFSEGSGELINSLERADPASEGWTFAGPAPRLFWFRRQAQENFLHRVDLESALGVDSPRAPELAADGVSEVFDVFLQRSIGTDDAAPISAPVGLQATDIDQGWTIQTNRTVTDGADGAATISGPAEALLLLLWKRIGIDDHRLNYTGDEAAIAAITKARLTP